MNYDKKIEEGISRYLEKVASYLRETPPDEADEIIRDLQSHIYDALASRSGAEPTPADLEAVLSEMDPPESYGPPVSSDTGTHKALDTTGPTRSLGSWAMAVMIYGVIIPIILAMAMVIFGGRPMNTWQVVTAPLVVSGIILELLALILGLASWREKTGKAAAIGAGIIIILVVIPGLLWLMTASPDMENRSAHLYPPRSVSDEPCPQFRQITTDTASETQPTSKPTSQPAVPDVHYIERGMRGFTVRVDSDLCPANLKIDERVDVMGKFSVKDQPLKTYPIIGGLKVIAIGGRGTTDVSVKIYRSVTLEVRHKVCSGLINVLPHAKGNIWLQRSSSGSIPFSIGTINPKLRDLPPLDTPSTDK